MIFGYKFILNSAERKLLRSYVSEIKQKQSTNILMGGSFAHLLKGDIVFMNIPKPYPDVIKLLALTLFGGLFVFLGLSWYLVVPLAILFIDFFADVLPDLGFRLGLKKKGLKLEMKRLKKSDILCHLEGNYVSV